MPDPNWMACALEGGILPPIETYQRDRDVPDGQPKEHPYAAPYPCYDRGRGNRIPHYEGHPAKCLA